jgi:hypothetical protein
LAKKFSQGASDRVLRDKTTQGMDMSQLAEDLIELKRLATGGAGALTEHLLREVALNLIAEGVSDERQGA